jgi:hypothetical protein
MITFIVSDLDSLVFIVLVDIAYFSISGSSQNFTSISHLTKHHQRFISANITAFALILLIYF